MVEHILDLLTCGVCQEKYDNLTHKPKIICCQGDTLCLACLEKLFRRNGLLNTVCPFCRSQLLKGSLNSAFYSYDQIFATNLLVLQTIQAIQESLNFKLLNSKEVQTTDYLCEQHSQQCNLFCMDQNQLICVYCERKGTCQSHKVMLANEAENFLQEQVTSVMPKIKKQTEDLILQKDKYEQNLQKILQDHQKFIGQINKISSVFSEKIQKKFQNVIAKANEKIQESLACLNDEQIRIQKDIDQRQKILHSLTYNDLTTFQPFVQAVNDLPVLQDFKYQFEVLIQDNTDMIEEIVNGMLSISVVNQLKQ